MDRKTSLKYPLLCGVVLGLLAGCSQEAPVDNRQGALGANQPHSGQALPADKKQGHAHYAKPGAQVALVDDQLQPFNPGESVERQVVLSSSASQGQLRVAVTASEGLHLQGSPQVFLFALDGAGHYRLPLTLSAAEPGRYYLHIQAQIEGQAEERAQRSTRSLSVIVPVGEFSTKAASQRVQEKAEADAEGRSIILQDAEETISP